MFLINNDFPVVWVVTSTYIFLLASFYFTRRLTVDTIAIFKLTDCSLTPVQSIVSVLAHLLSNFYNATRNSFFCLLTLKAHNSLDHLSLVSIWSPRSPGSPRSLETVYRRSKRLYGNSDGKLRDDRGDRDDRDRPDRTLLYPGDRDDRVKFTCDHMETVNRPDRLHTISSDRGNWGDRGDYMETRL